MLISESELIELEKCVWNALVSGDKQADSALLADDFLGVYATGFEEKADHTSQLDAGPTVLQYQLSEFKMKIIGSNAVLLSYQARYSRRSSDMAYSNETMYVTSIWQNDSGKWLNTFSQDTEANRHESNQWK